MNEATWDRLLRLVAGAVVLWAGWAELLPGLWGAAARIFGFIPLVTGAIGWSPLYSLLGVRTRRPYRIPDHAPRVPTADPQHDEPG